MALLLIIFHSNAILLNLVFTKLIFIKMSGNAGIRGYIIQTIICVLDSLQTDHEWISVTLEPIDESEKVDIRWEYPNDIIKLCQVKSSQNILKHSAAKKWCKELISHSPNASEYELILVGNPEEKLLKEKNNKIEGVKIADFKTINTQDLIDQASTKIDHYYDQKGKNKISPQVRELLVKALTTHFANNSIVGKKIERIAFDNELLSWIFAIEQQIENNPLASLAPPAANEKVEIEHRISRKILDLIGWTQFNEKVSVESFNERMASDEIHQVNFTGDFESRIKENTDDYILITSIHDVTYPHVTKPVIVKYLFDSEKVFEDLKDKKKIPLNRNLSTNYFNILFWLSSDNVELSTDFNNNLKENYKNELLNDEMLYFTVDNKKANFLISSIVTAKNYRDNIPVKFLYPITEANHNPGKIGLRGFKLPAEFINSSVIPIIKESAEKISVLIFCSDPFSADTLRKLIWLTIRLTSGLGNEYLIYFSDYEVHNKNESMEVIRSFNDEDLQAKITILKYHRIDSNILDSIANVQSPSLKNESYDELNSSVLIPKSKHLNEAFTNILPYGDIIKPFLKTEAITASDLKIFLAKKGIYIKGADKTKLISIMSSLLFSPSELDDFKSLIDIKDRPPHTTQEILTIKENDTLDNVFKKIKPNTDNVTDNLDTKLLEPVIFKKNPENPDEYIFTSPTERKDPTNQISINTSWGKVEVSFKKDGNSLVVNTINTISREDKLIANRIVKAYQEELKRIDFVEEETIKLMFSKFGSNQERVIFLLSFTDVSSSTIFKDPDIRSIKFKFDDNENIPDAFKDKKDKDLITYFSGKNLAGLNEISEEDFKKVLLLEEIYVTYKFDYLNIKNGFYNVKYNFSDALKNKPLKDGIFKSEPLLSMTGQVKELINIEGFKKELSKEIERIKLEKLRQFNIII
jgi:hypothetical protein